MKAIKDLQQSFILMTALSLSCSFQASASPAQGFSFEFQRPEAPNSVYGTVKNSQNGDYVLLRGAFIRETEPKVFLFADDKGDTVRISFKDVIIPDDFALNYEYFIWSQVERNNGSVVLKALFLSPRR